MSHNGRDDIATRLRREASATAPARLRADVMLQVRAEPRPQRIRPRRSFGRSFASVAAAACILAALVFGATRVDFGGTSSSSGGGATSGVAAASAGKTPGALEAQGAKRAAAPSGPATQGSPAFGLAARANDLSLPHVVAAAPRPLQAAVYGRERLAPPLRRTFGALDAYHLSARR